MTAKRFMVDDCGTLIDMHTRDTFDYVSDVCDLLNDLQQEAKDNEHYHSEVLRLYQAVSEENEKLKQQLQREHTMLDNAILLERTRMGQNSLKQYKEAIQ